MSDVNIIKYYKNGKLILDNVEEVILSEQNFCQISLSQPHLLTNVSTKLATVRFMFDNEVCDYNDFSPYWTCVKCENKIEFGLDTKLLYCRCGQSHPNSVNFIFKDILLYSSDKEKLYTQLCNLVETEKINILILGETGVGKSTWINGIFNYFSYENLKQAHKSELLAPIPSKFQSCGQTISVGNYSRNENPSEKGESCTRGPMEYVIFYKHYKLNVIDTPGVGDSRGIDHDKVNFEKTLSLLSNYENLHAVCILLKPNNTRNSIWFRFCIEELLTQLHASIVHNILFCFTNARSTFYQPGDTLPVLEEYLRRRKINLEVIPKLNCFCFDNEAFRYLACLQNGVSAMNEHFELFDKSWVVAREETLRLFECVTSLSPHKLLQTISLNNAREAVLLIAKPLAELVNNCIPENIKRAQRAKENLAKHNMEIDVLQKTLKVSGKTFKVVTLESPRTVCTGEGCWHFEKGGVGQQESKKVYHHICHNKCTIEGVSIETVNDARLAECTAFQKSQDLDLIRFLNLKSEKDIPGYQEMDCSNPNCNAYEGDSHYHFTFDKEIVKSQLTEEQWEIYQQKFSDDCRRCRHTYKLHMHITYDLQTTSMTFIDPEVQQKICNMKTEKERFKAASKEFDSLVKDLNDEKEKMFEVQVIFGAFIKQHALIAYNDAFEELVKMHIREEERLDGVRDEERLKQLQENLRIYESKKEAINQAMSRSNDDQCETILQDLTPDRILSMIAELKSLKHHGETLKNALHNIIYTKQRHHQLMQYEVNETDLAINCIVATEKPKKNFFANATKQLKNFIKKAFKKQ